MIQKIFFFVSYADLISVCHVNAVQDENNCSHLIASTVVFMEEVLIQKKARKRFFSD